MPRRAGDATDDDDPALVPTGPIGEEGRERFDQADEEDR